MDGAPLIKAHDHARAAAEATHASNSTVAINEHTRAAGEFANAAKSTSSAEALRTLRLLEQHHQRLSELLRIPLERATEQQSPHSGPQSSDEKNEGAARSPDVTDDTGKADDEKTPQPLPTLPKQQRYPSRDLGASIASNLASARGIRSKYRSQPLTPSISNAEAPGNLEVTLRRGSSGSKMKMQNMLEHGDRPISASSPGKISRQASSASEESQSRLLEGHAPPSDESFSKFYSAFGSIINKISAPLAFAGLPLISEESIEEPAPTIEPSVQQRRSKHKSPLPASAEPDLGRIYSRATMRAISRDGQSATDSFYVVPPSGHTASYASILSYADKEKRRMEASIHGDRPSTSEDLDEDDFVDAKESQAPGSPGLRRKTGRTRSDKELSNVVEELYLENKSLKDMLDKLSQRLHAFESISQTSGMRLAESMRLMRPGSPISSGSKSGTSDEALRRKNQELEEQLIINTRQMEELQKDYNKARANLVRYREKWEQLKAGAKARRAGGMQGTASEANTDDGTKSPSLA
ncbi:hypothetical protein BX600DRAFT_8625 [Xylariales sp. PMI_506]|nr:hypothetical protein BX600DRAFT_8625 [Xylariales sp. PMI_506]